MQMYYGIDTLIALTANRLHIPVSTLEDFDKEDLIIELLTTKLIQKLEVVRDYERWKKSG